MWVLDKTDHGIDGWDSRTTIEALFTTYLKAMNYIRARGFIWEEHGSFYHMDPERRNTMGAISYRVSKAPAGPPVDPG